VRQVERVFIRARQAEDTRQSEPPYEDSRHRARGQRFGGTAGRPATVDIIEEFGEPAAEQDLGLGQGFPASCRDALSPRGALGAIGSSIKPSQALRKAEQVAGRNAASTVERRADRHAQVERAYQLKRDPENASAAARVAERGLRAIHASGSWPAQPKSRDGDRLKQIEARYWSARWMRDHRSGVFMRNCGRQMVFGTMSSKSQIAPACGGREGGRGYRYRAALARRREGRRAAHPQVAPATMQPKAGKGGDRRAQFSGVGDACDRRSRPGTIGQDSATADRTVFGSGRSPEGSERR